MASTLPPRTTRRWVRPWRERSRLWRWAPAPPRAPPPPPSTPGVIRGGWGYVLERYRARLSHGSAAPALLLAPIHPIAGSKTFSETGRGGYFFERSVRPRPRRYLPRSLHRGWRLCIVVDRPPARGRYLG